MATRLKTVEYIFPTNTATLAAGTRRDFTAITAHIPEASGTVTFKSVVVEIMVADDATVAGSVTSWLIGIKLGLAAFSDATVTDTITNSGEAQTYKFTRDVTSYFTANWTGASVTMQVGLAIGGRATQNHFAKVYITYEYDDTQATHVKTVRIPLESTRQTLTTAYQTIGGATAIPAFKGGYLPENTVTVRQVWIELWGNTVTATNGDFIATARVGGGTTYPFWDNESALISATFAHGIIDITAQALLAPTSLEAILTTTSARMGQVGGMICCSYTYNDLATTTVFNSIMVGAYDSIGSVGGTTAANRDVWGRSIFIEEPAAITMKESGVCLFGIDNAAISLTVGVGGQTARAYAGLGAALTVGQYSFVHRFDAGGQVGSAGMTLARGRNDYKIYIHTTVANTGWNIAGFCLINYTSGKHVDGTGAHAHSVRHHIKNSAADDPVVYTTATAPSIPETNYWLNSVIVVANMIIDNSTAQFIGISAHKKTGEGEGDGWECLYGGSAIPDNENNLQTIWGASRKAWKRWSGDLDADRMDLETVREYKTDIALTGWSDLAIWFTYHTITKLVSGNISGKSVGTVNIGLHRTIDGERIAQTSRVGVGPYSFTWFDDTEDVFVVAKGGSSHLGLSDDDLAV